jgi:hypothetical protein
MGLWLWLMAGEDENQKKADGSLHGEKGYIFFRPQPGCH